MFVTRCHTINEPIDRDLGTYAVYAHEMLQGKNLYTNLFDNKPPLLYLTFAFFEYIFGYKISTFFIIGLTTSVLTLISIYYAGRKVSRTAAVVAAVAWSIASANILLEANQPNTEVFNNLFLSTAFTLLILSEQRLALRSGIFIGILLGFATMFKHITFVPVILFTSVFIAMKGNNTYKNRILQSMPLFITPLILWSVLFGYYYFFNDIHALIYAVFTFNKDYASTINNNPGSSSALGNIVYGLQPQLLFTKKFFSIMPLFVFAFIGILTGIVRKQKLWIYLLMYAIAVTIMISLPGKWYPHYYQLWLPVFCIGSGWFVSETYRSIRKAWKTPFLIIVSFSFIVVAIIQLQYIFWSPIKISNVKYGPVFVESEKTAKMIHSLLINRETFYQYGSDVNLYFYTKKTLPTAITFSTQLNFGKASDDLTDRLIQDLNRSRPELVVFGEPSEYVMDLNKEKKKSKNYKRIIDWVQNNYVEKVQIGEGYWVKKGGRLDRKYEEYEK